MYKSGEGYHAVPPPYIGTFMPPKPDLVFHDTPTINETVPTAFNVEPSTTKPNQDLSQSNRPPAPLVEDWVSDSKDESESEPMPAQKAPSFVQTIKHVKTPRPSVQPIVLLSAARPVNTAVPQTKVTIPRLGKTVVTNPYLPKRRPINLRPSPPASNFPQKVTTVKDSNVNAGNLQHALKDKGVIDSGWLRHITGNMSYLSDFEELHGGYVAFGGNSKGGKVTCKGKIKT
nr:hypothetical protein [Tanacetum cinerariifolium]